MGLGLKFRGVKTTVAFGLALFCAAALGAQQNKKKSEPAKRPSAKHSAHHTSHTSHKMKNGNSVERRSNGRVSNVHDEGRHMDIHHGLNGDRRVSSERADHSRVVSQRGRPGYIERGYAFHGHDYYRRSYYWHGHAYFGFYRGYYWHGVGLHYYAPWRFYPLGFYGWAYHPWHRWVVYDWGWGVRPWYGHYGFYFAPYAAYANASTWLTDYMLSADLEAAYEAGRADGAASAGAPAPLPPPPPPPDGAAAAATAGPMLTPEVKDMIAQEIQRDIQAESGEAALNAANQEGDPALSGLAGELADGKPHVFVVGEPLDVDNETTGEECALSEGDVLQTTIPPGPEDKSASLVVLASKGGKECARTASVTVSLEDLQEMQNHMRMTIDQGMEELQKKQGTGGLPAAPPNATTPPVEAAFAQAAPPPEQDGEAAVEQQQKTADQSEVEVTQQEATEQPAADQTAAPAPIVREPPSPAPGSSPSQPK
jgi:hypothetical protein